MKTLASRLLYWSGHLVSIFLYCDYLAFLYPVYKKLMIWSSDLDKDDKVWKSEQPDPLLPNPSQKLSDKQMNELIEAMKKHQ